MSAQAATATDQPSCLSTSKVSFVSRNSMNLLIHSFFVLAASSLKIFSVREFNTTAFVSGMIPPVVVCILFIMKLGYRSRYASTAVEDEALEEERLAFETNNINIFT